MLGRGVTGRASVEHGSPYSSTRRTPQALQRAPAMQERKHCSAEPCSAEAPPGKLQPSTAQLYSDTQAMQRHHTSQTLQRAPAMQEHKHCSAEPCSALASPGKLQPSTARLHSENLNAARLRRTVAHHHLARHNIHPRPFRKINSKTPRIKNLQTQKSPDKGAFLKLAE